MASELERAKGVQACEILDELDLDCWLIWVRETEEMADPALKLVFPGSLVWASALLFTREGERIAIVGRFDAGGIPKGLFDRILPYDEEIRTALRDELIRLDPETIAIDISESNLVADGLTVGMHRQLLGHLAGTRYADRLTSAESLIGRLRSRKLPEEIARIARAVELTEELFADVFPTLAVGQMEREIQQRFHERVEAIGAELAWARDHNPAVDAGPDKAFGHLGPTDGRTRSGELLHFDFGLRVDGFCSDLQRMVFFGARSEVPDEIAQAFESVRDAIAAAADALKPGVIGHEVDAVARSFLTDRGYAEYMHALGHQVGRSAHDGGTLLGPQWERYKGIADGVVEAGNVFTLEPHVATVHHGMLSLEEDVLVTETGCRFLSTRQTELICIC